MRSERPVPAHVAIVMDGNGRWAEKRKRPRTFGHQAGLKTLRRIVEHSGKLGVQEVTVFAFSSENWKRPQAEINRLMDLFRRALDRETEELHANGVRLRFLGDLTAFAPEMQESIRLAEHRTRDNDRMALNVAVNYGGRWDIVRAARRIAARVAADDVSADQIDETLFAAELCLAGSRDPDLLIRTGGEMRISNFLLWQSAYTELYFTPLLWPDFGPEALEKAITAYRSRERRFGRTSEQIRMKSA